MKLFFHNSIFELLIKNNKRNFNNTNKKYSNKKYLSELKGLRELQFKKNDERYLYMC